MAWFATIAFYNLYAIVFFVITLIQPRHSQETTRNQVAGWFAHHHEGLLVGFALIFTLVGFSATSIALITYSIRRMSVSLVRSPIPT